MYKGSGVVVCTLARSVLLFPPYAKTQCTVTRLSITTPTQSNPIRLGGPKKNEVKKNKRSTTWS